MSPLTFIFLHFSLEYAYIVSYGSKIRKQTGVKSK